MLELTQPILNAIDAQRHPVHLLDPRTQKEYVLVSAEQFESLLTSFEDKLDIRGAYPLMDAVARREGWDDPEMDIYNDLAPKS